MALDTTLAGASADSFATLVEIRAIAAVLKKIPHYKTVALLLDAVDDDVLEEVARMATANLSGLVFVGFKQTATQALPWPRVGPRVSTPYLNIVPEELKKAQVLEMAALMDGPVESNTEAEADIAAGIQSKSMGQRSVVYNTKMAAAASRKTISSLARDLLDRARLLSNSIHMPRG